ncbi:thrombopoietin isoform X1 [Brachyhypopomus gauderio]|uniref:thrombopoietin isoform X1 n=1 Tax=Brachyhypopomus gauderio TaxID=698409 RepID=UPI004041F780
MDLNKVLFLLLSIVASKVDQVETRPLDFVCDSEVRRVLNKVKDLQQDMVDCGTEDFLPTSIRLPCIKVHKATWGRKSVLERKAEILQSLGLLAQDVRRARTQSQPGCGLLLLERLEHSINNYLHVVTQLHSEGSVTFLTPAGPLRCWSCWKQVSASRAHTGRLALHDRRDSGSGGNWQSLVMKRRRKGKRRKGRE